MDENRQSATSIANDASSLFATPRRQHQGSTSKVDKNAEILLSLESVLRQSGGRVPLCTALDVLRKGPGLQRLSATEVLNACSDSRGRLSFHAMEGEVVVCRGEALSSQSQRSTDYERTTTVAVIPQSSTAQSSTGDKPSATRGRTPLYSFAGEESHKFGISILQPLPPAVADEYFPAFVLHVVSPEAIIINLVGHMSYELEALLKTMNDYYSSPGKGGTGGLNMQDLVAGALCAYPHVDGTSGAENWRRGVVTIVHKNGILEVTDVDIGVKSLKLITCARQLASQFRSLPRQAVTVRLCRLRSAHGGVWGHQARARLAQLICGETVMCRLVNSVKGVPSVIICNTNGPEDVYASTVLIEEGLAVPVSSDEED